MATYWFSWSSYCCCFNCLLELLESSDKLVKKLWKNTKYYKKRLLELGFDLGQSETPITPIMTYDSGKARVMSLRLFEEGVYALPIVFPMVAKDKARIRTMITWNIVKKIWILQLKNRKDRKGATINKVK